jgi:hypothetical protein
MTDPIADIIGDDRAFAAQRRLVTATGPDPLPRSSGR